MTIATGRCPAFETPISLVKGTADWLPADHTRLAGLETLLLDRFDRAGYVRLKTPVLEPIELHGARAAPGLSRSCSRLPATPRAGSASVRN